LTSERLVFPCVYGDVPERRIVNAFGRTPGGREAYQFEIQITCFDRSNNTAMKPVSVRVEVQNTADPSNPTVQIFPHP
jgi:hypothetical protein